MQDLNFAYLGKNVLISPFARFYGTENISIGDNSRIDDFCIISAKQPVTIGRYVHIAPFCGLYGVYGIEIHDYCGISSNVAIYSGSDDYSGEFMNNPTIPMEFRRIDSGKVILEKQVSIGCGCVIFPNVKINKGSTVMAMSLVAKNIPESSIVGGIPARFIKHRSTRLFELEKLLEAMDE